MPLPHATSDLEGIGGTLGPRPDDVEIEEVPRNKFAQKGPYLYVLIEKKGIGTLEALRQLSEAAQVPPRDLSAAGFKGPAAVTRQWVAIRRLAENGIMYLETPSLNVVSQTRHNARLHAGHMLKNRFKVRIRKPKPGALAKAEKIIARLVRQGVPNFFGVNRLGPRGDAPRIGRALLRNDLNTAIDLMLGRSDAPDPDPRQREARSLYDQGKIAEAAALFPRSLRTEWRMLEALARGSSKEQAARFLKTNERRFFVAALQAQVFNKILARRIGEYHQVKVGDLVIDHATGAATLRQGAESDAADAASFACSATGLVPGTGVGLAAGEPGIIEQDVLSEVGVSCADFDSLKPTCEGERRPLRFRLEAPTVEEEEDDLVLQFEIPPGAYATSFLRELLKVAIDEIEEDGPDTMS
ncbi:MAG: tRNA pseudouridine(13) synthase TruD [Planctomycetota bacterium]